MYAMERFFEGPNELWILSRRFLAEFRASATETTYRKDTIWLAAGQPCRELLFIQSGNMTAIRDTDCKPCTTMLYGAGNTVIVGDALFRGMLSTETFRFLSDSRVFTLSDRTLDALTLKYPDARLLLNYFVGDELNRHKTHNHVLSRLPPEARVAYAHANFREPFLHLTREEQASFLGMPRRVYQRYV